MAHTEIAVVGGGVIGLSIAYRLATAGRAVTVLEASLPGQASGAAAGMLAPLAESNALPALAELGLPSLRQYPAFLAELADASGITIGLCGPGILRVAATDDEAVHLCATLSRPITPLPQPLSPPGKGESEVSIPYPNRLLGKEREAEPTPAPSLKVRETMFPVHLLTASEARAIEPALSPDVCLAIHSPAEKHVMPSILLQALRRACERAGVAIVNDSAHMLRTRADGWTVATESDEVYADILVVAAGAWTGAILRPLGIDLPIVPLKGQICSVRFRPLSPDPSPLQGKGRQIGPEYTIYAHNTYIVPRPTGEIVIGATEEPESGFSLASTEEAVRGLRERAARVLPALAGAALESARVGFRPASPDRLPMIGKLPGCENGYIASGHGRNGILLTPITADIVRDMIVDGIRPPASVDPARFATLPSHR
jgi:glycine oxidase